MINAVGAATTGVALVIIIVAKFTEGAWITILVIPCVIVLLKAHYYDELTFRLRDDGRLDLHRSKPPIVLVATEGWNRLTDKALDFALSFSLDVIAVHLAKLQGPDADQETQSLHRRGTSSSQRGMLGFARRG